MMPPCSVEQQLIMALQRYNLNVFTKGWFVGNFSPSLLATDAVEVAAKRYRAGDSEGAHFPRSPPN